MKRLPPTPAMLNLLAQMQTGGRLREKDGWWFVEDITKPEGSVFRWRDVRRPTARGLVERGLVAWDGLGSPRAGLGLASYYRAVCTVATAAETVGGGAHG